MADKKMPRKISIRKYVDKRCENVLKHLDGISDAESIHKLRIEIKKLRSIRELLLSANLFSVSLKRMKPLYRTAGNIRSAQLIQKIIGDAEYKNEIIEQELNLTIEKGYTELISCHKTIRKAIKEMEERTKKIKRVDKKSILMYFKNIASYLSIRFLWPIDKEQLHESRGKIKNLLNCYNLLPDKMQSELSFDAKYLDQLQESIGQWNDHIVVLQFLSDKNLRGESIYLKLKQQEEQLFEFVKKQLDMFEMRHIKTTNAYSGE